MDLSQLPLNWYILLAVIFISVVVIIMFITVVFQGRPLKVAFLGIDIGEKPKGQKQRQKPRTDVHPEREVADSPPTRLPESLPNVKRVVRNDLGKGVKMGGQYQDPLQDLELVSSDWARWQNAGWVKSGWFYNPPDSDLSHAVAFFKIHCHDNGKGYVHVLSASSSPHKIWLHTDTGSTEEHTFIYSDIKDPTNLTALKHLQARWPFTWKRPNSQ